MIYEECLKYIENIFSEMKLNLATKKEYGLISATTAQYEKDKFNNQFSTGAILCINKNELIKYYVNVRDAQKFLKARKLINHFEILLYFKQNKIYEIQQGILKEILPVPKVKKATKVIKITKEHEFTEKELQVKELEQAKRKKRELLQQIQKLDDKIERLTPKYTLMKKQKYEMQYFQDILQDDTTNTIKIKTTTEKQKAKTYKKYNVVAELFTLIQKNKQDKNWQIVEI